MIATRQSKLPYMFGALIATAIVAIWALVGLGVISVEGASGVGFASFVCLFILPLAIFMWIRVFRSSFAARTEGCFLHLWSTDLVSRHVRIPVDSVYDVRITEKKFSGEPLSILRLFLSDGEEVARLRSTFRSAPHFGFFENNFDCCLPVGFRRLTELSGEIQQHIKTRGEQDDARQSTTALDPKSEGNKKFKQESEARSE